jgi:hypothetical protein
MFRGFCGSTVLAWSKYATLHIANADSEDPTKESSKHNIEA